MEPLESFEDERRRLRRQGQAVRLLNEAAKNRAAQKIEQQGGDGAAVEDVKITAPVSDRVAAINDQAAAMNSRLAELKAIQGGENPTQIRPDGSTYTPPERAFRLPEGVATHANGAINPVPPAISQGFMPQRQRLTEGPEQHAQRQRDIRQYLFSRQDGEDFASWKQRRTAEEQAEAMAQYQQRKAEAEARMMQAQAENAEVMNAVQGIKNQILVSMASQNPAQVRQTLTELGVGLPEGASDQQVLQAAWGQLQNYANIAKQLRPPEMNADPYQQARTRFLETQDADLKQQMDQRGQDREYARWERQQKASMDGQERVIQSLERRLYKTFDRQRRAALEAKLDQEQQKLVEISNATPPSPAPPAAPTQGTTSAPGSPQPSAIVPFETIFNPPKPEATELAAQVPSVPPPPTPPVLIQDVFAKNGYSRVTPAAVPQSQKQKPPPHAAVEQLRRTPWTAELFDRKWGPGAAARYLKQGQ